MNEKEEPLVRIVGLNGYYAKPVPITTSEYSDLRSEYLEEAEILMDQIKDCGRFKDHDEQIEVFKQMLSPFEYWMRNKLELQKRQETKAPV